MRKVFLDAKIAKKDAKAAKNYLAFLAIFAFLAPLR